MPVDIDGPYVLVNWVAKLNSGSTVIALVNGTSTDHDYVSGAVVDAHGSLATT